MKKTFFLLLFAVCAAFQLHAQAGADPLHPILNTEQLAKQRTYYNLDSALANPDDVYKLSITDQKLKVIPTEIGTLRNLQLLNISNCKVKVLPLEIKECKNLQDINLSANKLRFLPVEMRELKQLQVLYIGQNRLFELPAWLGTLTKLRLLDISRNALTPADVSNAKRMLPKATITY